MCARVCVSVMSCRPTVKMLSPEDGKQSIVQAAQQLCQLVENKERSSKDIDVSMLDILLRGTSPPDPCSFTGSDLLNAERIQGL